MRKDALQLDASLNKLSIRLLYLADAAAALKNLSKTHTHMHNSQRTRTHTHFKRRYFKISSTLSRPNHLLFISLVFHLILYFPFYFPQRFLKTLSSLKIVLSNLIGSNALQTQ
jgi:hypothetical protein